VETCKSSFGKLECLPKLTHNQNKPALFSDIIKCAWQSNKGGKAESIIKSNVAKLKQLARKCDLLNPEEVKETLAKLNLEKRTKTIIGTAYTDFLKYKGLRWQKRERKNMIENGCQL